MLLPRALVIAVLVAWPALAAAQIDTEPRLNLELGGEGPLRGEGATAGYGFLLWNRPHFLDQDDLYFRIIFAPTYLTSELVRDRWPGPGHAFGIGIAGGFFPYNFDEFRGGRHRHRESFWGHGGEATVSYYRRVKLFDLLPVEGQLRLRPQYAVYQRSGDTGRDFRTPADTPIYSGRVGIRVGGEPPELLPAVALEVSGWYEASYRQFAERYGFPDQRITPADLTQQAWGRAGGIATLGKTHTARLFVTAGTAANADELSTFRLGSALPFRREFPLVLHGYFIDEVFARRFWLVNASYRFPLWPGTERVRLQLALDYARVEYLPRHALPRRGLRGIGADLTVALTQDLTLVLGYGYGPDALRGRSFGGHEGNVLLEVKF